MSVRLSKNKPKLGANHKYNTRHRSLPVLTRHNFDMLKYKPLTAGTRIFYYRSAEMCLEKN